MHEGCVRSVTQTMVASSHYFGAASCTSLPPLVLPSDSLEDSSTIAHAFRVPVFHHWSTSLSSLFTPKIESSILMSTAIDTL